MRSTEHRFTRWAAAYEDDGLSKLLSPLGQDALTFLELSRADDFLDVGCGSGAAVRSAAVTARSAVGVDSCEAMIDRARKLALNVDGTRFVAADCENLPFDDGTFSALACVAASRHFVDLDRAIGEMARVLTPSGRLCLVDFFSEPAPRRASRLRDREPYTSAVAAMRSVGIQPSHPVVRLTPFGHYFSCLAALPDVEKVNQARGPSTAPGSAAAPGRGSLSSTKIECVSVPPMFSPACS